MNAKTLIVGGGMAGLACAYRLLEADQDFLLITDSLGGRIMYSETAKVNYGAYFVMGNYKHAKKLLIREDLLNPLKVCFHNSETERFGVVSLNTLRLLPECLRFLGTMLEFSSHYEKFKKRCLNIPHKVALQADPYMARIFTKPAAQFVREKRFEKFAADYVSKFMYACTGASLEDVSTLDFLNVSMGLILPIHRFKFDQQAIKERLGSRLITDAIVRIEKRGREYALIGKSGAAYLTENVVLATPASVTKELLNLEQIRATCKIYVYHVRAELKPIYRQYEINLFPFTSKLMLTAKQFDGTYLIYGREKDISLNQVCKWYEVISYVPWEQAMYVFGDAYLEQKYDERIFVAGDHNGLGLEPTAISGIYAANQIIRQAADAAE